MKTLINLPSKENSFTNNSSNLFSSAVERSSNHYNNKSSSIVLPNKLNNLGYQDLLTSKALYQMSAGDIPDLWNVCIDLYNTFLTQNAPYTAMQFIPVLKKLISINPLEKERFLKNTETNHVLIQNEWLKVVLIHWKPGKYSAIHGHPAGGCVFKVLHGAVEEKRYTTDANPELVATSRYEKGSMAYIDDQMAYHAVGNPYNNSAISLHVYTPGLKTS